MKRSIIKKGYLVLISLVLLVALLGISVTPVMADGFIEDGTINYDFPGELGAYFDINFVSGFPFGYPTEAGAFCAQYSVNFQYVNYYGKLYDYFLNGALPPGMTASKVIAIAYILNHVPDGATWQDMQWAFWKITDNIDAHSAPYPYPAYDPTHQGLIDQMINGAIANPTYSPPAGARNPIFVFVDSGVQLTFYWVLKPGTPPVPELPAGALLGMGIIGLGGIGWLGYRRIHFTAG